MPRKKSSCMKRVGIGCTVILGMMVILVLLAFVGYLINKPEPMDIQSFSTRETLGTNQEATVLPLGEQSAPPREAVTLDLDLAMTSFRIVPDGKPGEITVDSVYDQANFTLETNLEETEAGQVYRLSFKSKKRVFGMIFGDMEGVDENEVTLHVPQNMVYDLDLTTKMGDADLDLTGLAIRRADLEMSMGSLEIDAYQPSPIVMESMVAEYSMGEFELNDYQNLRIQSLEIDGGMGEASLRHSGPITQDMRMVISSSMGEVNLSVPDNVRLEGKRNVVMGELADPGTGEVDENSPTIFLDSHLTMGEMNIDRRDIKPPIAYRLDRLMQTEGVEAAAAIYREATAEEASDMDLGPTTMNRLAYRLIRLERWDHARVIAELTLEAHPENLSTMIIRSLVAAHDGDLELADAWYLKARDIAPEDWQVRRHGRRLDNMRAKADAQQGDQSPQEGQSSRAANSDEATEEEPEP